MVLGKTQEAMRLGLWFLAVLLAPAVLAAPPGADRQQQLLYLLRQDCGSCHGMTLRGGLGPALTPAALAGKPADLLVNSIVYGRPGTAMPPWQGLLEWTEAVWLVDRLLQGIEE